MHTPSLLRVLVLPLPLLLAAGCITLPKSDGELDSGDGDTGEPDPPDPPPATTDGGDGDDSGSDGDDGPEGETGVVPNIRAVDILVVLDNSGSMGEEQAKLVGGIDSLLDALDSAVPPVDYRIAVTTTDNGNPWCDSAGNFAESGALVGTSCAGRILDFVFNGAETIDVREEACLSVCDQVDLGLPDPWIEVDNVAGATNVPSGDARAALACMLPQGINGCGFEQPLQATALALQRMQTPGDPAEGFHRPGALLAVALVTDEVDCSTNPAHDEVFLPEGNHVFWSDPTSPAPTSALCWNAGVQCIGAGPYDDCFSVDLDVNGDPAVDPDLDAVMRPLDGYVDQLDHAGAFVVAINGVSSDGSVYYADTLADPSFQEAFGIGPGCSSGSGEATPPVRVRELVDAVSGPGHQHSICDDDFGPALASMAQGILARLP